MFLLVEIRILAKNEGSGKELWNFLTNKNCLNELRFKIVAAKGSVSKE